MEQDLTSQVWQMRGVFQSAIPGYLVYNEGRMAYITENGEQFNVPLSEVRDVKWPGLQMGLGFHAVVEGKKYKFTFMKPNGAAQPSDNALTQLTRYTRIGRGIDAVTTLAKWGDNKKSAKAWKEVLNTNA